MEKELKSHQKMAELVFDSYVDKSDAENLFGLDTDFNEPLIGLFSNRFSEE